MIKLDDQIQATYFEIEEETKMYNHILTQFGAEALSDYKIKYLQKMALKKAIIKSLETLKQLKTEIKK